MKAILKYSSCILLTGSLQMALSCKKEDSKQLKQAYFNAPFELTMTNKTLLQDGGKELNVDARNISDNRCSTGNCTGDASLRLHIADTRKANAETILYLGMCNGTMKAADSVTINLKGQLYRFVLNHIGLRMVDGNPVRTARLLVKPLN